MERAPEPEGSDRRWAIRGARALMAVAVALALVALVLAYLGRALFEPQPFADRAVATLRYPAVRDDLADRLTNAVTAGDLVAVRPLVRSIADSVIASPGFAALLRRGALQAHAELVSGGESRALLTVSDAGVLVGAALQRVSPGTGAQIAARRAATLGQVRPDGALRELLHDLDAVFSLARVPALLALLAAALSAWLARDLRRTVWRLGVGLLVGGLALVGVLVLGRAVAQQLAPAGRAGVVAAVWSTFLGGLRVQALWVAVAGAVCAGAATGRFRGAREELRAARDWLLGSGARRPGLVGAALLIALGAVIILEPGASLTVAVIIVGAYVLYRGVLAAVALLADGRERLAEARRATDTRGRGRRRGTLTAGIAVAAVAGVAVLVATGGGDQAPAAVPLTCNGYVALCDRTLNRVALAATHNSMASVTIPHWLFGQQDGTIADQLQFGIRGLLIDTYFGFEREGRVETDLETLPKLHAAEQELGPEAVAAALRIRARLGRARGRRRIYLCHGFCELGAITLASALADLRAFLVAHPGEVVVIINQDEGVPPADIEQAVEQAGLLDLVYRGPLGPFPTLREMIDSGQRVVVMAENDAGAIPWYHLAYRQALQETPFRFRSVAALTDPNQIPASCAPNRGPRNAPLFLVNNWVDTTPAPRPSLAAIVDARGTLLHRAQACQRIRGLLPNLVAVDFYRRGDVLGVVNALNGVQQ